MTWNTQLECFILVLCSYAILKFAYDISTRTVQQTYLDKHLEGSPNIGLLLIRFNRRSCESRIRAKDYFLSMGKLIAFCNHKTYLAVHLLHLKLLLQHLLVVHRLEETSG